MATATAMAALRAKAFANVVATGGGDEDGCHDGRSNKGSNGREEGNDVGDDGGDCGGDGDSDGYSVFGVKGCVYGIGNMATKSIKTMTLI
jgi:hypothetical protein